MLTKADISRLRSLREKKHREETGLFVVEGAKVINELLAAGQSFAAIYATDDWAGPDASGRSPADAPPPIRITAAEMARISHFPTPAEVLAVGRIAHPPLPPAGLARGLTLALDGVQDPGNVGTLLRIADWFACDRVALSPDCAGHCSAKVIHASMGSFARVPVHRLDLAAALAALPPGTPVLGCDLTGDDVRQLSPLRDAVIVIGSEGRGLSPAVRPFVTHYVTIPRLGGAESLNAAVAAAIVCDNLRRVQAARS